MWHLPALGLYPDLDLVTASVAADLDLIATDSGRSCLTRPNLDLLLSRPRIYLLPGLGLSW